MSAPLPLSCDWDHIFKVLLIGDAGVGKSSMLLRFTDDAFEEQMASTIGVDFRVKTLELSGKTCKLTIWDTAGQERFRTLTSSYYRGCHGIIVVFDVNERETFENLPRWLDELELYTTTQFASKLLVGNKTDLDQRQVSEEEAQAFARKQQMMYIEASAKTRKGIQQAFEVTPATHTPHSPVAPVCACSAPSAGARAPSRISQEVVQKILDTPKLMDEVGGGLGGLSGANLKLNVERDSESRCSYC